ncbi:MAG: DUF1214 domain-containing protein [Myxococcota bacterium]|jgi:hypothetical protein|nr:hypothetical protein [Deltaproteobacteria bacterium]MCP4243521.1 DUF1214 domain-containing protein [bacterium]MDP6075985.1 DUF1214 domain-containing protein [Myxococcota bacterium]MDP7076364.1 DUF1214 domain-containing protein [Myxococcota bacterium]MDP7299964.1 DUF1214 domain-containing protein [Myxococcota bacterium]
MPQRDDTRDTERLVSGAAWDDLCEALRRAGREILSEGTPDSPQMRAEGFRHLAGLLVSGVRQSFEMADPARPRFWRNPDSAAKWGAENSDNQYLWTCVDPALSYRIRGQRGSAYEFLIEAKQGYMQLGDSANYATLTSEQIETEEDGSFEVVASAKEHPGNWLPLGPDARYVLVRQYFNDWEHEDPARFWITCLDSAGSPAPPAEPAAVAQRLDAAGHWVETTIRFWNGWVAEMRAAHEPGKLLPAIHMTGGADDIRYGNDLYRVAPDQALILETEPPLARYWSFQLCSLWFETLDYTNRQTSLNGQQIHVDSDGRVRVVIAHRDPGIPNWLDAAGHPEGMIQYRWIWSQSSPHPSVHTVPLAELRDALPADTPRVTPDQRRRDIAGRQEHIARREPAT